jgi:hypothetical protein
MELLRWAQGRGVFTTLKSRPTSTANLAGVLRNRWDDLHEARSRSEVVSMIYILAALLPPVGLLLNGQPFSALLNVVLIVPCVLFGLLFPVLFLVPSAHAIIAVYMRREDRRHREIVDAIERHGPPPGFHR